MSLGNTSLGTSVLSRISSTFSPDPEVCVVRLCVLPLFSEKFGVFA